MLALSSGLDQKPLLFSFAESFPFMLIVWLLKSTAAMVSATVWRSQCRVQKNSILRAKDYFIFLWRKWTVRLRRNCYFCFRCNLPNNKWQNTFIQLYLNPVKHGSLYWNLKLKNTMSWQVASDRMQVLLLFLP